jgi:hypothetical protein
MRAVIDWESCLAAYSVEEEWKGKEGLFCNIENAARG